MFDRITNWFKLLAETILYIKQNGWKEYRLARKRYDTHQKALKDREFKYTHVGEIKRNKEHAKQMKR